MSSDREILRAKIYMEEQFGIHRDNQNHYSLFITLGTILPMIAMIMGGNVIPKWVSLLFIISISTRLMVFFLLDLIGHIVQIDSQKDLLGITKEKTDHTTMGVTTMIISAVSSLTMLAGWVGFVGIF